MNMLSIFGVNIDFFCSYQCCIHNARTLTQVGDADPIDVIIYYLIDVNNRNNLEMKTSHVCILHKTQ